MSETFQILQVWSPTAFKKLSDFPIFVFVVYRVEIFTGKKAFAGTNANIYLTIFGTRGATNKLKFVDHDKSKFEKGKMDSF